VKPVNTQHRLLTLVLLLGLAIGVSAGESVPSLPQEFWGAVTIDGSAAPAGTVVVATINGTTSGSVTTTVAGVYGGSTALEGTRLVVSGAEGQEGQTVAFLVDGTAADQTATFTPGTAMRLDLTVQTMPETGSISVTSVPSGASISLDGAATGVVTNGTLTNIPVGDHTVSVNLAGYRSASQTVPVSAGQTAPVHFALEEETGSISVTSVPFGASISLDGVSTGQQTNTTLTGIPVGDHTISVTLAGYEAASKTVAVSAGQTASVHFALEKETGSISVTSVPAGASISLDGAATGVVTNGTLTNIPVGDHTISVTLTGHEIASQTVTVSAGQTAPVHFTLEKETGSISVTSVPSGASISLDGVSTGHQTNATLTNIPVGAHTVSVTLAGYESASQSVTVSAGQTAPVHFTLTATAQPPVAAFSASVTSGDAPLEVAFTDTSSNAPTSWSWTFGDGATSSEQHPTHTYTAAGIYTVSLTVANAVGSDSEVKVDLITVTTPSGGFAPVANFVAEPTSGAVPLSVQFTDTSINATSWSWSFGDGGTSTEQHPVYTYTALGWYDVSLTVTNTAGSDTLTRYRYINVRDVPSDPAENETDYVFHDGGTNVTTVDGRQQISFNATAGNGTVSGNDILLSTGNLNVTIETDGLTTNGTVSTGNVTGVLLESNRSATASLDTAGNVSVGFNASMNGYNPDLRISTSIYDRPSDEASTAFTLAAADEGLSITSTAYAVYFTKTNLGANDTLSDAYLRMTVSPAWVEANGGPTSIRIFRQGDDGTAEVLDTTYLGLDADGMMVFEAYSPNGFSAFAVVATTTASTPSSSSGGGGGSSVTPTTSTGTATLLTASWGGVLRPYLVYTEDKTAHLYLKTGVTALDDDGDALSRVGIAATSTLPAASSLTFAGYAVDCSPDGATFSPAIDLVFTFTAAEWSVLLGETGGDPTRLVVQGYDASTGTWAYCPTSVDADDRTVAASIAHFSTYGLFIEAAAEVPTTTAPATAPTTVVTAPATTAVPATETGGLPLTWIVLIVVVILIGGGAYLFVKRR